MTSSKDDIVPNNSELTTPNSELNTRKRVFLVDGNSYLYRAFLRPLIFRTRRESLRMPPMHS